MPTGVHIPDVREQLFAAAERVLARDGPSGLTSRAVTTEAGCAKGVLHRHFADFEAFLVDLVSQRVAEIEGRGAVLRASAGTGTVAGNLGDALIDVLSPVAIGIVALITYSDELRGRLRRSGTAGVPLMAQTSAMVAGYLAAERECGRVAADVDIGTLGLTLVGAVHLLLADRTGDPAGRGAVHETVSAAVSGALRQPSRWEPGTGAPSVPTDDDAATRRAGHA